MSGAGPQILLVCTANICRSPMAEALLRHRLDQRGLSIEIVSAGLLEEGLPVSDGTLRALETRGIDVSAHQSRRLDADLVASAALVIGMERRHVQEAVLLARDAWPRSFTLKELVRRGESIGPRGDEPFESWLARVHEGRSTADLLGTAEEDDVADPYGLADRVHRRTAKELDDLVTRLASLLWGDP